MVIVCILALTTILLWSMKKGRLEYCPLFRGKITAISRRWNRDVSQESGRDLTFLKGLKRFKHDGIRLFLPSFHASNRT
jgi:hypothetical protein